VVSHVPEYAEPSEAPGYFAAETGADYAVAQPRAEKHDGNEYVDSPGAEYSAVASAVPPTLPLQAPTVLPRVILDHEQYVDNPDNAHGDAATAATTAAVGSTAESAKPYAIFGQAGSVSYAVADDSTPLDNDGAVYDNARADDVAEGAAVYDIAEANADEGEGVYDIAQAGAADRGDDDGDYAVAR
jgi:hypothetical protein